MVVVVVVLEGGGGSVWKVVECYRLRRGRYEVIIREHKSGAGNVPLFHPGSGGAAAAAAAGGRASVDIRRLVPSWRTGCVEREEAGRARGEGRKWVGGVSCRGGGGGERGGGAGGGGGVSLGWIC